jgi:Group II intron, maturase-specific domain
MSDVSSRLAATRPGACPELRSLRGSDAQAVIRKLNPIIRGWANYYRTQVSSEAYSALDAYLWRLTWKGHLKPPGQTRSPGVGSAPRGGFQIAEMDFHTAPRGAKRIPASERESPFSGILPMRSSRLAICWVFPGRWAR